jgi:hypothetical protein
MYVLVTGLKTKDFSSSIRFWYLTIPASRVSQKSEGIFFCENKSLGGYPHTFTVWVSKKHMMVYFNSPIHHSDLNCRRAYLPDGTSKRRFQVLPQPDSDAHGIKLNEN